MIQTINENIANAKNALVNFPDKSAIYPTSGAPTNIMITPNIFTKPLAAPALPGNMIVALLNKVAYGNAQPNPNRRIANNVKNKEPPKKASNKHPIVLKMKLISKINLTRILVTRNPPKGLPITQNKITNYAITITNTVLLKCNCCFSKIVIQFPITITKPKDAI